MADENVEVKVGVQVDGAKTLGTLKKDIKEAQGEALLLSRQFGEVSPQAIAAAKKVAALKDEFNDLNERVKLFDPGAKFQALGNVVGTVSAGFTAAQGALSLFGTESDDLQKQLVRLQGAMAFSQGLSGIFDASKSFKDLGAIIKTNVVGAFTTLKGAMAATGIGLIVVAIGTLAANFKEVEAWLQKIIPGFEGFGAAFNKVKVVAMGVINGIIESFKVIGEIVGNVFTLDFEEVGKVASEAGARIGKAYAEGQANEIKKQTIDAAKEALKLQAEEDARRLKVLQASGESRAKEAAALQRKMLQDAIVAAGDDIKARKDAQAELDAFDAKTADDRKKKADADSKAAQDKRKQDGQKALADLVQQQDFEYQRAAISGKDLFNLKQQQLAEQKGLYVKYGLDLKDLRTKQEQEELDQRKKLNAALKEDIHATTGVISTGLINVGAAQKDLNTKQAANNSETAAKTEEAEMKKQQAMLATNNLLNALVEDRENLSDLEKTAVLATMITTMFAEEGKRSAMEMTQAALQMATKVFGEETAAGKAFAIAGATIETYKAAQMSFSAFAAIPIVGPALGAVAAAAAIVAGIARVKSILKVKVPGGKDAGSAPSAATSAPAMPRVQGDTGTMVQQLDQVNSNLRQPQRVQVVESEITDTQKHVQKVEALAQF